MLFKIIATLLMQSIVLLSIEEVSDDFVIKSCLLSFEFLNEVVALKTFEKTNPERSEVDQVECYDVDKIPEDPEVVKTEVG